MAAVAVSGAKAASKPVANEKERMADRQKECEHAEIKLDVLNGIIMPRLSGSDPYSGSDPIFDKL